MAKISAFQQAKQLGNQIDSILSFVDSESLASPVRQAIVDIKRLAVDARLEVRDYDYADTRAEQRASAADAKQFLEQLQNGILQASEYNIFGAADVAQLSARIDQLIADLQ